MSIRFEGTFNDGTEVTMQLSEHSSLPDLLSEFKKFTLACGYIVDPLSELEFIDHQEPDRIMSELEEENLKLKRKIRKLKKQLDNKNVVLNCEIGKDEFLEAATRFIVANLE